MSPQSIEPMLQTAIGHHRAGRLGQAEDLYKQILRDDPNQPDALHLLGLIAHQAARYDVAVDLVLRAIALKPGWPEALYNLGLALNQMGRVDEAITAYRQAIAGRTRFAQALNSLGCALKTKGQLEDAIAAYREAIAADTGCPDAYNNLGNALRSRGDLSAAVTAYRKAITVNPNYSEAYNNLGVALAETGDLTAAIAAYDRAIALKPGYIEALANLSEAEGSLGNTLAGQGQLDPAIAAYQRAIAFAPRVAKFHNNLASVLFDAGQLDQSIGSFTKAVELAPDNASFASGRLSSLHYSPRHDAVGIADAHFHWNQQYASQLLSEGNDHVQHRRLRIGYVSPDLRSHPVGRFLLAVMEYRDRDQFEIYCYSDIKQADAITERYQQLADHWRETATVDHSTVAEQVRADQIDILVDLSGHTRGNRLLVFARKPAPVQVSYLGYPGTTGMKAVAYRLTDELADPPGMTEHLHSETLIRLPRTNWCYSEPPNSPEIDCLHKPQVRFCSFNNFAKVTDAMLQIWARILREVPRSCLMLKADALTSASARARVQAHFTTESIPIDRLAILPKTADYTAHLSAFGQADIALDTFPYHGTATTCDALWMGVPVITLAGQTHVSRVGVSLLNNIALPELIAATSDQYVRIAVQLAGDPDRLHALQRSLRDRMKQSPLMDGRALTRHIEAGYHRMWQRLQQRQS